MSTYSDIGASIHTEREDQMRGIATTTAFLCWLIPDSALAMPSYEEIREQPFTGGSLLYDTNQGQTQLAPRVVIPFRLGRLTKGKQLANILHPIGRAGAAPAAPKSVFDLKDDTAASQYGLLTVQSVDRNKLTFDVALFDSKGALLNSAGLFVVKIGEQFDLNKDGIPDIAYKDTLESRPSSAQRSYLIFLSSESNLHTALFSYNPIANKTLPPAGGLLGFNIRGNAIVRVKPSTTPSEVVVRTPIAGDIIMDVNRLQYLRIPGHVATNVRRNTSYTAARLIAESQRVTRYAEVAPLMSWRPIRRPVHSLIGNAVTQRVMSATSSSNVVTELSAYEERKKRYVDTYNASLLKKTVSLAKCGVTEICSDSGSNSAKLGLTKLDLMIAIDPDISISLSHVERSLDTIFIADSFLGLTVGASRRVIDLQEMLLEVPLTQVLDIPGTPIFLTATLTPGVGIEAKLDVAANAQLGVDAFAVFGTTASVDIGWDSASGDASAYYDYCVHPSYELRTKIGGEYFIGPFFRLQAELTLEDILYVRVPATLRIGPSWKTSWDSSTNIVETTSSLGMAFDWHVSAGARIEITVPLLFTELELYKSWEPVSKDLPGFDVKFWEASYRSYPSNGSTTESNLIYPIPQCNATQVVSSSGSCVDPCQPGMVFDLTGHCVDMCKAPMRFSDGKCICDPNGCPDGFHFAVTNKGCVCYGIGGPVQVPRQFPKPPESPFPKPRQR
jgi:hypothetical protein